MKEQKKIRSIEERTRDFIAQVEYVRWLENQKKKHRTLLKYVKVPLVHGVPE